MKQILIGLLIIVFVTSVVIALVGRVIPSAHVYLVAEVQAGLRQQPQSWAGHVFLLRGVIAMQGQSVGCGRPACPVMSWIVLLPTHEPIWRRTRQLWASMDLSRQSAGGHRASVNAIGQGLVLVERPGYSPPPAHASGPLPDGAYHIPLLGPLLSRWLPEAKDNSVVLRVHLAPWHSCAILGLCPDGWVV